MKNRLHVKTGDKVYILNGKDRGKKGKILSVDPTKRMVLVEGINIVKKHVKPRSQGQQGGIIEQPSPINVDKVMLVCDKCGKPTRVGKKILDNGQKQRMCKKCNEMISVVGETKK